MQKFYARFRSSVRPSAVPFQYHLYKGGASVYIKKKLWHTFLGIGKGSSRLLVSYGHFLSNGNKKALFPILLHNLFFSLIFMMLMCHIGKGITAKFPISKHAFLSFIILCFSFPPLPLLLSLSFN